jgi:4-alpha-glucanotransferase
VFRIDHFRGFAGYYEIPASCPTAEDGVWVPGPGKALFESIERTLGHLPIVAEDLGLITEDVIELRDGFEFPGMKILQFGFGSDASDDFLPHNWARNFVAYTGTHDNDTVRGWWQGATDRERAYAGSYLATDQAHVHWAMIRACCNSVANIAVFPLQDVLGLDGAHRMNVPGTVGPHNWTWRFDWQWLGSEPARVLGLISAASGRGPLELLRLP